MRITQIVRNITKTFKQEKELMNLHRWGNHISPESDCYQRMENCMAMKYYDYHNIPSVNEKLVTKKTEKVNLGDVTDPDTVMMRLTMIF